MTEAMLAASVLRGCFLVMSGDLYLHSHTDIIARHACFFVSLAAAAVHRYEVYLAAIAAWAIALVIHLAQSEVVTDEEEEQEEGGASKAGHVEPVAVSVPALPRLASKVKTMVDDSKKSFVGNVKEGVNCDGSAWTVVKDKRGIRVLCSDYKGKSILRWKVEMEVVASAKQIYGQCFDFDKRVGANGWDTALETGKNLCEFSGGYALQTYTTAAVAGGAIGNRRVIDVRHLDFERPRGGFCIVNLGIDEKLGKTMPGWLTNDKMKRAMSLGGSGVLVEPMGESGVDNETVSRFKYTLVSSVDLNVWVPTGIINTAMGGALLESHEALMKRMAEVTGQAQPTGKKTAHAHQD